MSGAGEVDPAAVHGYAFPWDVIGDPRALDRWRGIGVQQIALAASYHETRAATPLHPAHTVVRAAHAAYYGRIETGSWGRLTPMRPVWMGEDDSFGRASRTVAAAGFPVSAWLVLTHNSALGLRNPELCVINAWGDVLEWALCPSAPEVVEFSNALVAQTLAGYPVDGLVIEAAGPMGVDHRGAYDKTDLAEWTSTDRALLSVCFCRSCSAAQRDAGIDSTDAARRVRDALGPAPSVDPATDPVIAAVFEVRLARSAALLTEVLATARAAAPAVRITVHATANPRGAGPFGPLASSVAADVDTVVATGWDLGAADGNLGALRGLAPAARTGLYIRPDFDADALRGLASPPDELHLYHLGLVGAGGLGAFGALATAFAGGDR